MGATGVVFDPSTGQYIIGKPGRAHLDPESWRVFVGGTDHRPHPRVFGPPHSVYTGMAIGQIDGQTYIYGSQ